MKGNSVSVPKKGFSDLTVVIGIEPERINCKIKFLRDDRWYVVNYQDQTERFKKIQKILDQDPNTFKHKYEYVPNMKISTYKVYIFFHIVSTIFITSFFLRSSPMSNIKSSKGGSGGLSSMLNQKKTFEVVTKTKVEFNDVAGLD